MSNLVIRKFRKKYGIHDTECPEWDQVSKKTLKKKPLEEEHLRRPREGHLGNLERN